MQGQEQHQGLLAAHFAYLGIALVDSCTEPLYCGCLCRRWPHAQRREQRQPAGGAGGQGGRRQRQRRQQQLRRQRGGAPAAQGVHLGKYAGSLLESGIVLESGCRVMLRTCQQLWSRDCAACSSGKPSTTEQRQHLSGEPQLFGELCVGYGDVAAISLHLHVWQHRWCAHRRRSAAASGRSGRRRSGGRRNGRARRPSPASAAAAASTSGGSPAPRRHLTDD